MIKFSTATIEEDELWFRAEMNNRQFSGLSHKLVGTDLENELLNNDYFTSRVTRAIKYSKDEVEAWLKNAWNTERVLHENHTIIENTGQSFCMQWAFPQAYYAVFGTILAMFKAIGYTETTHTSVLRKYGSLMEEGKLPESISIYCNGCLDSITYYNIEKPEEIDSHMKLDLNDEETVNNHICQFLGATRKLRIKEKAVSMRFKKKNGAPRKRLKEEHWQKVSDSIGNTTIIDFLYRKRIKGNYQDIETYNASNFDGKTVLMCLCKIVDRINLVNEAYTYRAIGDRDYQDILNKHRSKVENTNVKSRYDIIKVICENIPSQD